MTYEIIVISKRIFLYYVNIVTVVFFIHIPSRNFKKYLNKTRFYILKLKYCTVF